MSKISSDGDEGFKKMGRASGTCLQLSRCFGHGHGKVTLNISLDLIFFILFLTPSKRTLRMGAVVVYSAYGVF